MVLAMGRWQSGYGKMVCFDGKAIDLAELQMTTYCWQRMHAIPTNSYIRQLDIFLLKTHSIHSMKFKSFIQDDRFDVGK